ncbi:response regulator [Desulfovibrio sp. OttesenSCG-928-G11]|nr:response regulator [Desulfovibrio sp. OttesenSCG-928-G11]
MADGSGPHGNAEERQTPGTRRVAGDKKPQPHRWALDAQPALSSVATWEWDLVTGVCTYSPEWAAMTGARTLDNKSANNWTWWSGRMHMDDMPGVMQVHQRFFSGDLQEAEIFYRVRRPDGVWIRLLSRCTVSSWKDDGTPAIVSGISIDISHLPLDPPLPDREGAKTPEPHRAASPRGLAAAKAHASLRAAAQAAVPAVAPEQRFLLNERRLSALYQLAQMDKASEDEVLYYTLTSILQLTNSGGGFLLIPGTDGGSRFFWSSGQRILSSDNYPPGESPPEALLELTASEKLKAMTQSMVNGDGGPLQALFGASLPVSRYLLVPGMEDGNAVCLAGVCNKPADYDKSDLRQMETLVSTTWLLVRRQRHMLELKRAKEEAEAASKAKNEFLANVSHELRTPLNGILSMLQLLEDFSMTRPQREYLKAASLSGAALRRIISDLLDFSRIEAGKMQLIKEPFDFKASVRTSLRLFREEAENAGLSFNTRLDPAIPELLYGDETRVRQILYNLVGNALKFTSQGGIEVKCDLVPGEPPDGSGVRIRILVTDTGIGIPKDKQQDLFQAFMQADGFFVHKVSGTGLGLSIVKRLTAMMDGSISLESEEGRGTSVCCMLSLEHFVASEDKGAEAGARPSAASARSLDVLVAEDDAVSSFALRSFLLRDGHRVLCVQNGRQALEALQLYAFDCLLTDIQMPDMDGLELVSRIRNGCVAGVAPGNEVRALLREIFPDAPQKTRLLDRDLPIVAVSAHAMTGDRERFISRGIQHYIAKPILRAQLNYVLNQVARKLYPTDADK